MRSFTRNPEGNEPLERYRRRWESNIKMDLRRKIGWDDVDCLDLAEDGPVEDTCERGNNPSGFKNVGKFLSN
jgi:hypothetical protein